jgi:hypothetical protein
LTAELKRNLLMCVFEAYDEIVQDFPAACTRECSTCCTTRVMATSAEADLALIHLEKPGKQGRVSEVLANLLPRPTQPVLSVNTLAEYCLRKEELPTNAPEELEINPCPLRERDGCPLYEARPFSCRSMWSREVCKVGGQAFMDPLQVTIAGVFQQIIEHIDCCGLYGNFLDLLSNMLAGENARAYRAGLPFSHAAVLTPTRPNPGFIVPPEHRKQIGGYLALLWRREVAGFPFRAALDLVRKPGMKE